MLQVLMEKASLSSRSLKFGKDSGSSSSHQIADDPIDETGDLTLFTSTNSSLRSSLRTSLLSSSPLQSHHRHHTVPRHRSTAHPFSLMARRPNEAISYELTKNDDDELGYLQFAHDSSNNNTLADGLAHAAETQKPVFYVQAVLPGDTDAGRQLFSHPLLVEAAATLFVATKSTTTQDDDPAPPRSPTGRICCTRVSLLDPDTGELLVPIVSGEDLTLGRLVRAMIRALQASGCAVPRYLMLLGQEQEGYLEVCGNSSGGGVRRQRNQTACFGMRDPALAEVHLAGLEGVLATRVGQMKVGGRGGEQKVVRVTYDSKELSYCVLVRHALKHNAGEIVYYQTNEERMAAMMEVKRARKFAKVRKMEGEIKDVYDPKHALRQTPMRFVPLTALQATRANRLIHLGSFHEAAHMLSPRQGLILMKAMRVTAQKSLHEVVDVAILLAWTSVCNEEHPTILQRNAEPVLDDSDSDE